MASTQTRPADNWNIAINNTALIVVDMQNIWVHPRGTRYLPMCEDIVPKDSRTAALLPSEPSAGVLSAHDQAERSGRCRYLRRYQAADP
jgi:nicotinamidase-related amidase